jgi:hypothetical protein
MNTHGRNLKNGEIGSGSVNSVQRIDDTVVRPIGEWSKSVHGLLNHLQAVGFSRAPRLIKTDLIHGKEILTYIDGEVAMRPWPLILLSKAGIVAIAQLLREYHDLIRNYRPGANSKWRDPNAKWQEGMIVRHGDLGPWNMVWKSSELVGLIDWDLAEPGYPIEDVAQAAWYCVPMRPLERCIDAGIDFDDQASRLEALCETYGADIDAVTGAIAALQSKEIGRIVESGKTGIEPWKSFMERGDVEEIEAEREWLQSAYRTTAKGGDG